MTTRGKYLLVIPAVLLLAVFLLLYRLTDVAAFLLERELRAAGFTDIVVDIQTITTTRSKVTTLQAGHPALNLRANEITLHYTLKQLLKARIDNVEIDALHLTVHEQPEAAGGVILPPLPEHWLAAVPFKRAHIKQARVELPKAIQGITHLDLQATVMHSDSKLEAQVRVNARKRPSLLLQLRANDEHTLQLTLNDAAAAVPAVTLQSRELMVTPEKLNTALSLEIELRALRSLATQWLPASPLPVQFNLFDTLHSDSKLEYLTAEQQLRADVDINLGGNKHTIKGPASLTYRGGQLAFVIKAPFNIEAREQTIEQTVFPALQLSVEDDLNCAYHLAPASWHCGTTRLALAVPEVRYPPYALQSAPGTITLQQLSGEPDQWQLIADLDLPAVQLALPDNTIRLDRVSGQLQASSDELKASAHVQAADGQVAMAIQARHNLQQQRGKAEIKLQPVSLAASHNIPGKLLRRWPYPVHIEAGQLRGQSSLSWQPQRGQVALEQSARLVLDNIQGSIRQYPFSGLQGKLYIKGIENLHITTSDGLHLASINPGVPITDILLRADASRKPGQAFVGRLHQFEANTLGGKISADNTTLDLNRKENRLVLDVQGLDLARLIKLEQKQGLVGTGKLNGKLPLILDESGLSMTTGKLSARPPYGVIRYRGDERVTALAKTNPNVELLVKALSDFHYNRLEADLDYSPAGELQAKVRLQGKNPELEGGRPVHLNITLEENIPALLRSLQFADEISRKIEEGIKRGTTRP